jgi:hypothetical protein
VIDVIVACVVVVPILLLAIAHIGVVVSYSSNTQANIYQTLAVAITNVGGVSLDETAIFLYTAKRQVEYVLLSINVRQGAVVVNVVVLAA